MCSVGLNIFFFSFTSQTRLYKFKSVPDETNWSRITYLLNKLAIKSQLHISILPKASIQPFHWFTPSNQQKHIIHKIQPLSIKNSTTISFNNTINILVYNFPYLTRNKHTQALLPLYTPMHKESSYQWCDHSLTILIKHRFVYNF